MSRIANVSPMTLGAVQLGMPYGVANRTGQPDENEARTIIAAAYDGGVTSIDTAAAYGESEAVIGRALAALGLLGRMTVVTKVPAFPARLNGATEARRWVSENVARSLERLGVERLDVCLLHSEDDVRFAELLLAEERISAAGCSVMAVERMRDAVRAGLGAVQIPASLADPRCTGEGDARRAEEKGVTVFARSVYLQGLLIMPEERVPAHLTEILPARRALEKVAAAAGMPLAEMALRYVLGLPGVASVVVGAESAGQVRESAAWAARGPLPADAARAAEAAVPDLPEWLITPSTWPKRAQARASAAAPDPQPNGERK